MDKTSRSLPIKDRLKLYGIKPRKTLGQNFLVNRGSLLKIVEAAELNSDDLVIEVGPGLGILTSELASRVRQVLAVEIDERIASKLSETFASVNNVKIIRADILDINPGQMLQQLCPKFTEGKRYKVVANIPYYITSPIIRHFLEAEHRPSLMVLLVQKEVGQQIIPSGKSNLLGLSVQLYARPHLVATIPAGNFYPRPKVDSVILRLDVYNRPLVSEEEIPDFFKVARAGFSAPRKQVKNSLAQGLQIKLAEVAAMLEKAGISPERRPGTLSLEEWIRLKDAAIYDDINNAPATNPKSEARNPKQIPNSHQNEN